MSDRNEYDALTAVLVAIDDVVSAAPEFPLVTTEQPRRAGWARPVAAFAGAFAAVLLIIGAATTMLASTPTEPSDFLAGTPSDDYTLVVAFFDVGAIPSDVLESIEARPEVADLIELTREEAAAEALQMELEIADLLRDNPYILPAQVRIAAHASSNIDELVAFLDEIRVNGVSGAVKVFEPGDIQGFLVPEAISEEP
jgi:hypothetical protein